MTYHLISDDRLKAIGEDLRDWWNSDEFTQAVEALLATAQRLAEARAYLSEIDRRGLEGAKLSSCPPPKVS